MIYGIHYKINQIVLKNNLDFFMFEKINNIYNKDMMNISTTLY